LLNENHENSKHQKPNIKQIPMTKIQNSKQTQWSCDINEVIGMFRLLAFRIWILFEIWDLRFGISISFSDKQIIVI
jgi:hypothetical protein